MTRYELFEAWLTPKEWATWKQYCLKRIIRMNGVSRDTAKAIRKRYLKEQVTIDVNNRGDVNEEWDNMTNYYLRWSDTPQGHNYWSNVNSRTAPVRTLPPMKRITNTPD